MALYINGNEYSHASAEIDFRGKPYLGITAINYSDELEREGQWGTSSIQLGVTKGALKQNGDVELLKSEWYRFLDDLGDGYGEKPFNIGISYREPGRKVRIDEIRSAFIIKPEDSLTQGASAAKVKLGLHIAEPILRDGKRIIKVKNRPRLAIRN